MKPIAIFKVMYEANWMENQMKRIEMKKKKIRRNNPLRRTFNGYN